MLNKEFDKIGVRGAEGILDSYLTDPSAFGKNDFGDGGIRS